LARAVTLLKVLTQAVILLIGLDTGSYIVKRSRFKELSAGVVALTKKE
jgi:uncharacterized protein YneF (UPF0154 family)